MTRASLQVIAGKADYPRLLTKGTAKKEDA